MRQITIGQTGMVIPQNALGALPLQRISKEAAVSLLRNAFDGGMRFFDTARGYSDSEEKLGEAFEGIRDQLYIASKTPAKTPEQFWKDLETSLEMLRTDHIDLYQFHNVDRCYRPGDGTGMYECMLEAKASGKIRHIGITTHKIVLAEEIIATGLYETLQYPFSYLSSDREIAMVRECGRQGMGFIGMKGLSGGLIRNSRAAMAFASQFDNLVPIWGIQRQSELDEWLSYMNENVEMNDEIRAFIESEKEELAGEFCRGCGYCMPCPAGIEINNCARMALLLRRAPSKRWLTVEWQEKMKKIEGCLHCNRCKGRCPYELDTPALLAKNYEDYKHVLAGEASVD